MKPYSKSEIESIYKDLVQSAQKNSGKHRLEKALNDIETAAKWAYNFNHIYTDHETEQLLKQISDMAVESVKIESPKVDYCVLIDSFLFDNRGLSQQYLRAMMTNGMHILVIYTNAGGNPGKDTLAEIEAYDKAEIISYPRGISKIEETKQVVRDIAEFSPKHIFLHLTPWDTVALMACHAVKGTNIYQINLTDHAYWMGAEFIDYNLEFRPYGMTVSVEKRNLNPNQCIALPYYPITPISSVFEGLPEIPENAVKVFTGGALYKMLGKDDIFFRIMERILAISPKVYILVAGFNPDKIFDEKVAGIKGCDRILQIGIRKDIDSVFGQCDIYLGTYPVMGGLMSQYAAKHGKPIVAYHDKDDAMNAVEEMVNFYQQEFQSYDDVNAMAAYAEKLIKDKNYRLGQGQLLQDGMMTAERFNKEFKKVITSHQSAFTWQKDNIDYDSFFELYLELENNNGFRTTRAIALDYPLSVLFKLRNYSSNIKECKLRNYSSNIKECICDVVRGIPPSCLFQWLFRRIVKHMRLSGNK